MIVTGQQEIVLAEVDRIVETVGGNGQQVIQILQAIQEKYRYLPTEALERVCELTDISPARIAGVASFYSQFRFNPVGLHQIRVCHGTACHVKGSALVQDSIERHLDIGMDRDTTTDGLFTVEKVACLGCCTLAPVVQIDDLVYGSLTPDKVPVVIRNFLNNPQLRNGSAETQADDEAIENVFGEIRIGLGSCCVAKGSDRLKTALEDAIRETGARAVVKRVGCVGICHQTPLIEVIAPDQTSHLYADLKPTEAKNLVVKHFPRRSVFKKISHSLNRVLEKIFQDDAWEPVDRFSIHVRDEPVSAFLSRQIHIATEHGGTLNPFDLEEYIHHQGFAALRKCLESYTPAQIIDQIAESGLRGRGGAGFHSATKWLKVRESPGEIKYVICNGDEGDPGAFMDRMLLESFPFRVIEGMIIAAYAVGASEAIFYVRAEYPLALKVLRRALALCEGNGYIGGNILGSDYSIHFHIAEGAGAFVSGEETALLASVEGKRSIPRIRPPYPAEKGLWDQPTLINNVETYSLVPWILREGAESFAALGTATSKGTKVFALAGKVKRGGLIEVPMGITIREVVNEIGGGVADGRQFKAVQVGGPSGGCVPAALADTPIDFEALQSIGAIMGSGGLVVLDDTDCMVDISRYFLQFTQNESCGKCTLCRIGSKRMLEIVTRLCEGKGRPQDIGILEELSAGMKAASFCGLGKTAPNPVLTSLRYFREEYLAHVEGRCPAGKCKALIRYRIEDHCIGCTICAQHCPVGAIHSIPYQLHTIDDSLCVRCDMCRSACPEKAVKVV
ncbi:MAG: NAD(P)H-dependent oxidoreductase subunit E [Candidatus Omnitrophica bacterium]|nr:Electron transport complex subunit RsxB [bacterium]MCC6733234.1 NAD(P)H-dependent oxidoreductase subunit E [Candidatus Omnitrophota bacterium]MCE7908303.1 proton-conducting membrane transporter [Candidatus Omnitrophica bacterium COP1]